MVWGKENSKTGREKKYNSEDEACITAADLIDSDGLLHAALSSCDIKISIVSQYRILVAVQYVNTQLIYLVTLGNKW